MSVHQVLHLLSDRQRILCALLCPPRLAQSSKERGVRDRQERINEWNEDETGAVKTNIQCGYTHTPTSMFIYVFFSLQTLNLFRLEMQWLPS